MGQVSWKDNVTNADVLQRLSGAGSIVDLDVIFGMMAF